MWKRAPFPVMAFAALSWTAGAQEAKTALEDAAKTMGALNLKSIQYSGSGYHFALGQSAHPDLPWPRFNLKTYRCLVNYETVSWRQEMVRTQGENPPRGGGGQPLTGEQRLLQLASVTHAWNVVGENITPAPAALTERSLQIWMSPHGLVMMAAVSDGASVSSQTIGGKKVSVVSLSEEGKLKVKGIINDQNLVEKVEAWIDHPVLGDMLIETSYSNYRDFGGVKFPTSILQKQGGFPVLEVNVTEVQPNAPAEIEVPQSVREAGAPAVRVESQEIAEGVWYLTGGSHHSVAVEFNDHLAVIEGPLNEERSAAVIAEIKRAVPGKPIRYLVNTHHHFDHSGGIRTYAAEGATIVSHEMNKPFYERVFASARTLNPDRLAQSKKKANFQTFTDRHVLSDGTRTMELHHIKGNIHNDGIIMAYLPKEKLLIEADVYSPGPPGAPPPSVPNPNNVNLYENIERLNLEVNQIAPIHGRLVTLVDLRKAIGKSTEEGW